MHRYLKKDKSYGISLRRQGLNLGKLRVANKISEILESLEKDMKSDE